MGRNSSINLKTKKDLEIFNLCKKIQKSKLSKNDKVLITLMKTQMEKDWRKYLIRKLIALSRKYKV